MIGHPPHLVDGVEEEPLHDLEVVVGEVSAVVDCLLLGDQEGQGLGVLGGIAAVATDDSEDGVA